MLPASLDLSWDQRRAQERESELRRVLDEPPGVPHHGDAFLVQLLTQISRAETVQGKYEEAERTLLKAEKLVESVTDVPAKLRTLLARGLLLTRLKSYERARTVLETAYNLARLPADDVYAIDALDMMSRIETPTKRHEWTQRALELAVRSEDSRAKAWRAVLYQNAGLHFLRLRQFQKAEEAFSNAADNYREQGLPTDSMLARSLVGRTWRMMNKKEEALVLQQELLTEFGSEQIQSATVHEEIAECLHESGKAEEAKKHFKSAYELLSAHNPPVEIDAARLNRLKKLGGVKPSRN